MTTSEKTKDRFPGAVYAAAGVGELAYQQLRKLPAATAELREQLPNRLAGLRTEIPAKVAELRTDLPAKAAELRTDLPAKAAELRTDLPAKAAELRTDLPAKAAELRTEIPAVLTSFVTDAYTTYHRLVKRGRRVVAGRGVDSSQLKPVPLPEGVDSHPVVPPIEPPMPAPALDAVATAHDGGVVKAHDGIAKVHDAAAKAHVDGGADRSAKKAAPAKRTKPVDQG